MRPAAEQGFTLLEMLVALAVFSLAGLALINLAGENTKSATVVEARTLAGVVAENRAVEAVTAPVTPLGETSGTEDQGGRAWAWSQRVSATDDPTVLRVDIGVRQSEFGSQILGEVTVFRSAS